MLCSKIKDSGPITAIVEFRRNFGAIVEAGFFYADLSTASQMQFCVKMKDAFVKNTLASCLIWIGCRGKGINRLAWQSHNSFRQITTICE